MNLLIQGRVLEESRQLPAGAAQTCVTSPPYWGLRDYGAESVVWGGQPGCQHEWITGSTWRANASGCRTEKHATYSEFRPRCDAWRGSLGLEPRPDLYVDHLVEVFREVRRVLRQDGTLWLNLGDSYYGGTKGNSGPLRPRDKQATNTGSWTTRRRDSGTLSPTRRGGVDELKTKDLVGVPWRVAFALQADGWWLRSDIIWAKPDPMPESAQDRPSKTREYVFLLAPVESYFYDRYAALEPFADQRQGRDDGKRERRRNRGGRSDDFTKPSNIDPSVHGGRDRRSVWTVPPRPFRCPHLAMFPEALVELRVAAGGPEFGCCCSRCFRPFERVLERTEIPDPSYRGGGFDAGKTALYQERRSRPGKRYLMSVKGWAPARSCSAPAAPSVVLDPFMGSGATGAAARRLRRGFVGIDLSPEYVEIARGRISSVEVPA